MLATFTCSKCGSNVPKGNKIMHEINCEKIAENKRQHRQSFQYKKGRAYADTFQKNDNQAKYMSERYPQDKSRSDRRKYQLEDEALLEMALALSVETLEIPEHPVSHDILAELPQFEMNKVDKLPSDKKECVICMSEFEEGEKAMSLPCMHIFHLQCIKNWFQKNNTCPICKYNISDPAECAVDSDF